MLVTQDLNFDMARVEDEFLDEHAVIAKAVQPLALHRLEPFAHVLFAVGEAHPLAATARAGLHHHRIADIGRDTHRVLGILDLAHEAGDDVDARFLRQFLGLDLVAHGGNRVHRRADKGDASGGQRLGKAGPFRQETIARMHRLRPGLFRGSDDLVGNQIGFRSRRRANMHRLIRHPHERRAGISVGIDRHRLDTHATGRLDHPAGDFATIGDKDFLEH